MAVARPPRLEASTEFQLEQYWLSNDPSDATTSRSLKEYELIKLVSVFLYPLGTVLLMTALSGVAFAFRRWRIGRVLILSAFAWLWIFSMPATSNTLQGSLERQYVYRPVETVPNADLIVILGGGAFGYDSSWPYPNLGGNIDRYVHGARLYHAKRARKILLSGARDPRRLPGPTEAQLGAEFLNRLGVPAEHQILDNDSRTTQEHVDNVARLLKENDMDTFLLVTTAIHMRRAEAVFRAGDLEPIAVATDFRRRSDARSTLWHFIPNVHSLSGSTAAIHEYFGYWFYRIRGWM